MKLFKVATHKIEGDIDVVDAHYKVLSVSMPTDDANTVTLRLGVCKDKDSAVANKVATVYVVSVALSDQALIDLENCCMSALSSSLAGDVV
jgi:hypothetical protein